MENTRRNLTKKKMKKQKQMLASLLFGGQMRVYNEKVWEISTCMSRKVEFRQSKETSENHFRVI